MTHDSKPLDQREVDETGIHWDQDMSYDSYLSLDKLLDSQKLVTGAHDEMMFVIIHQASELWMKLCIHEIGAAMREVENDNLGAVFKMLSRVSRIQGQLRQSWAVLSTMTPADYLAFRDDLGQSSGFQSFQYREIEFALGNKNAALIEVHRKNPQRYARLREVLHAPSFYDLCLGQLGKKVSIFRRTIWTVTGRSLTHPAKQSRRPGPGYILIRRNTGTCMNWRKNSSISNRSSPCGASAT